MTGVILAGGESRRMGRNKAFIEIAGERIIDRTVQIFQEFFDEILIVSNAPLDYAYLNVRVVTDLIPGKGSLGGLYTGLFFSSSPQAFFVSCDMPFINRGIVSYFLNHAPNYDVVVYHQEGYWEPLHAVYSRTLLRSFERLIAKGDLKIIEVYKHLRIREVTREELLPLDPDLRSLVNINTPEDLRRIEETQDVK